MAPNEIRVTVHEVSPGDLFRDAIRSTRRLDQELETAAETATEVGSNAEESGNALTAALGERASGALDNLMGSAGGAGEILGKLGPYGKAAAAAIGVAMLGAALAVKGLEVAISASIERAASLGRMKAQLLLSPEDAAKYGKIAGQVYADNWGESLEQASEFVRDAALYIMPTASDMDNAITPSLRVVSERVAALAATMDEDGKKVADAIKHMLTTGMAGSVDEAFDLIHAGIAKGVNSADDLLDTFVEYSTVFREVGINGREAMGLISQGLAAGARDADTMADAIKELGILVQDTTNTKAQDAFKSMGLNAQKLGVEFNAGGGRAKAALGEVLKALNAIEDPLKQRAIAIALFGTKAEDLGAALFNMDLDQAAKQFENIGGAADVAAAHMSGNAYSAIEAYRRQWELFKADMGDKFIPVFEKVLAKIQKFAAEVAPVVSAWLADLSKKWDENKDSIEQFGQLMGIVLEVGGKAILGFIMMSVNALVTAIAAIGVAWQRAKEVFAFVVGVWLAGMGMMLNAAVTAFGWIPGIGPKLKQAQAEFATFRQQVNAELAGILDKDVHVRVQVSRSGEAAPVAGGVTVGTGSVSGRRIMASGGIGSGLTYVHQDELIDLGASARVYNRAETSRMLNGSGGGGGGPMVLSVAGAGNNAGLMASAQATILRYLFSGSIKLVDSSGGRVRMA